MRTAYAIVLMVVSFQLSWAVPPIRSFTADMAAPAAAVRRQAALRLGSVSATEALPLLSKALHDSDGSVRWTAARSLGRLRDPHAVPVLIKALSDPDTNVRFYAADGLGRIADPAATHALLASLGDPQWTVRNQAAWALATIGGPTVASRIVRLLHDEQADVSAITWILRRLPAATVQKELVDLLQAPEPFARRRAAWILSELRPEGAVDILIRALHDTDLNVQLAIIEGLVKMRAASAIAPLKKLVARQTNDMLTTAARQALTQLTRRADLLAYWNFDRPDPRVVRDVTDRGNDGALHGGTFAPGKQGLALELDGKSFVEFGQPVNMNFGNGPLSVMAWVRTDAASGVVIAKGGKFCGFSLYVKDGRPAFGIHRVQEGPTFIARGPDPVTGRWVHLAGVIKEDRIELYVDGKPVATAKTAGYIPGVGGQGLEIGFDVANSPVEITDHFHGLIDEVKVIRAALTGPEIVGQMETKSEEGCRVTRACDGGCARSVWKTDLPVPPTWISGGATNRFLGAIGGAALRAVTAWGSASWLEVKPR